MYTPAAGYSGPDSFTYTVNDGTNPPCPRPSRSTVTNATPIGQRQQPDHDQGNPVTFNLAGTDRDDCN